MKPPVTVSCSLAGGPKPTVCVLDFTSRSGYSYPTFEGPGQLRRRPSPRRDDSSTSLRLISLPSGDSLSQALFSRRSLLCGLCPGRGHSAAEPSSGSSRPARSAWPPATRIVLRVSALRALSLPASISQAVSFAGVAASESMPGGAAAAGREGIGGRADGGRHCRASALAMVHASPFSH